MNERNRAQRRGTARQWLRLCFSLTLALTLALILLFIPVTAGPVSILPVSEFFFLGPELVQAQTGLTITKIAASSVNPGSLLTYTLTVTNNTGGTLGPGDVAVSDQIPANTTIDCASQLSAPGGWSNPICSSGEIMWILSGSFGAGASVDFSFRVTVDDPLSAGFEIVNDNYFVVQGVAAPVYGPPFTTTVILPRWSITKTASSSIIQPGDYLTYTITIANVGDLATSGVYTITDPLPNGIIAGSVTAPEALDETASPLVWIFADSLAPGGLGTRSVTYSVRITSPLASGTEIVNAGYTVEGGGAPDPATNDPVIVTVDSPVTLSVAKIAGRDPVTVSHTLLYTITVTNNADTGPALDLIITDTLPASVTYQSASGNGAPAGGTDVVWSLPSIPVSGSNSVTVAVTVDSAGSLINQFQASASNAPLVSDSLTTEAELEIISLIAENDSPNAVHTPTAFTATANVPAGVTYTWDFDDGGPGSGPNPNHIYTQVGTYLATVNAENGVSALSATTVVTITPGPLAGFELQATSPQTAGDPFPLAIRAIDAYDNTVTNFNEAVDLSDTTGTISPIAAILTDGTVTVDVTVTKATAPDDDVITAEYVNGAAVTGTVAVEIEADPNVARLELAVAPTSIPLCGTTIATTTAFDQYDNPIPDVSVEIAEFAGSHLDPATDSGVTDVSGRFVTTFQAIRTAIQVTLVALGGGESVFNSSLAIAGASSPSQLSLSVSPDPLVVGGNVAAVAATVRDCLGPMSGQEVTFTLSDLGLASFPGPSDTAVDSTNLGGVAAADLTSGDNPGTLTITATVGTLQEFITLSILENEDFYTFLPLIVKQR